MRDVDELLEDVYMSQERMTRDDLHRRAVAANLPAEVIVALDALPEGEYAQDEVSEALVQIGDVDAERASSQPLAGAGSASVASGVAALELGDDDLLRELAELHRTRHDTLRHGSDDALETHDERMTELEAEYLRRFPEREVDPERMRAGARTRPARIHALEDTDEVARAVDDEAPVPALASSGGAIDRQLGFREPESGRGPGPREAGSAPEPGVRGSGAPGSPPARTGAEQEWEPADLAVAEGRDPTPRNIDRARQELIRDGSAAIERTVP